MNWNRIGHQSLNIVKRALVGCTIIFFAVMGILGFFCEAAPAADQILSAKVEASTVGKDKNGAEFVRLIINEQREVQGVKYTVGTPVMAFRDQAERAKAIKPGQTVKAVVTQREWQGRKSYTVLSIVEVK